MPANPKTKRTVDKKYLKWIRTQPCLVADAECYGDIVYHHTVSVGAGGSDLDTVPLCKLHHYMVHSVGSKTFQEIHEVDFKVEIEKLNKLHNKH